jgi:uncharacterized protein (DUF1800 family)
MPGTDEMKAKTPDEKKDLRQQGRQKVKNLNTLWFKQLIDTEYPLLEKTTLFWHGHFSCRIENPYMAQQLNNLQRQYAFAPFKELLMAVSKSPAMLQFLNNRQNHKQHPNENFARELMELFTIGHGNYTELDIKESARAFTGWNFDNDTYEFLFKEKNHDADTKTFMGQTGNFSGEDIINVILQQKQTAVFLCNKFYRFFVNQTVNEKIVNQLADYYFQNNYDTGRLLTKIFTADWFYSADNMGTNIKSPVEFIAGFSKTFGIVPPDDLVLKLQKALGQILFFPPNVAGWAGGKNYIDNSTLMLRLKIPSIILNGGKVDVRDSGEMPEDFTLAQTIEVKPQTKPFYTDIVQNELIESLLMPVLDENKKIVLLTNVTSNKQLVLKIVSMPEYQLC